MQGISIRAANTHQVVSIQAVASTRVASTRVASIRVASTRVASTRVASISLLRRAEKDTAVTVKLPKKGVMTPPKRRRRSEQMKY